jgi:hypothetical protein
MPLALSSGLEGRSLIVFLAAWRFIMARAAAPGAGKAVESRATAHRRMKQA